ncbi:MAG: 50S ribosome-binding GTPase [Methylococcales bacterium]|nr:50S ribosome-binding GTPase [Methylococcales bacterium]
MLEFVQLLKQRYQTIETRLCETDALYALYQQRIEQLVFTEAFLKKGDLLESYPETPLQIAIIGPTQAGKSSISNLILNSDLAGVSPLAGYTVHPQGFCCDTILQDSANLQNYFGRFQQLNISELNNHRYDSYALTENKKNSELLPACVFWDTPDFDSIDSTDYREGVIRTIALADIIVLVVSKEKYADQSVWEMMEMIESFHQPTLICVNKMIEGTEDLIFKSLKEKWQHVRNDSFPEVIPLYYHKQTAMPVWPVSERDQFLNLQKKSQKNKHFDYQKEFLNKYWHSWLEPVVTEHVSIKEWHSLVDKSIEQALGEYQRDYLNHPHYYDTFQNALIKLLGLLEIPGISKILTKTRRVLTWPVRKIMSMGKLDTVPVSLEVSLLNQIGEHLLISLSEQLLGKIDSDTKQHKWWKDNYCLLRKQKNDILNAQQLAIDSYYSSFQLDVEETANRLYNKLSEQPILLNSLRATRVSTDAAAMALVIYTGGIGVHDLVITPAMLSITSLLTESAVGGYMGKVEAELKKHQLDTVKQDIFIACLQQTLYTLPEQVSDQSRFNISVEQLQKAELQRKEKKHGIRIL